MKGGIQRKLLDTLKWAGIKVITVKQTWGAMISVNEALVSTLADICDDYKNPTVTTQFVFPNTRPEGLLKNPFVILYVDFKTSRK